MDKNRNQDDADCADEKRIKKLDNLDLNNKVIKVFPSLEGLNYLVGASEALALVASVSLMDQPQNSTIRRKNKA